MAMADQDEKEVEWRICSSLPTSESLVSEEANLVWFQTHMPGFWQSWLTEKE
jgi:hypothetical protein